MERALRARPIGLKLNLVHSLTTADFDHDDKPDLIAAAEGSKVALLRGRGDGSFDAPLLFDTGGGALLPVDVNLDSLPDLVTASEVGVVAVLLNASREEQPGAGDCNHDGCVTINELIRGVRILLGKEQLSECVAFDGDRNGQATIADLIQAVGSSPEPCTRTTGAARPPPPRIRF